MISKQIWENTSHLRAKKYIQHELPLQQQSSQ